jgi:hypothetical protein
VELELDPPQPAEVAAAVAALAAPAPPGPDPWWEAGLEDALGAEPQDDVTARPRSSFGAERA